MNPKKKKRMVVKQVTCAQGALVKDTFPIGGLIEAINVIAAGTPLPSPAIAQMWQGIKAARRALKP